MKTSTPSLTGTQQVQPELFDSLQNVSCSQQESVVTGQRITISFSEAAERYAQLSRKEVYKSIAKMAAHLN